MKESFSLSNQFKTPEFYYNVYQTKFLNNKKMNYYYTTETVNLMMDTHVGISRQE